MKRHIIGLALLLLATAASADRIVTSTSLVANLPATCSPTGNQINVTDGSDADDCSTGLGSNIHACYCNATGDGWVAQPTGGAGDIISEGDSNVEVIDAGTGQVDVDVDATNVATWTVSGLTTNEVETTMDLTSGTTPTLDVNGSRTTALASDNGIAQGVIDAYVEWLSATASGTLKAGRFFIRTPDDATDRDIGTMIGVDARAHQRSANTSSVLGLVGVFAGAYHEDAVSASGDIYGLSADAQNVNGTVDVLAGIKSYSSSDATSTATTIYGALIDTAIASGATVTNRYGIYLDETGAGAAGTNDYALFSNALQESHFSGLLSVDAIADRDWNPETFDLEIGDTLDEGQVRIGNTVMGQADDTISTTVLDDIFIIYNDSDSIEDISFALFGPSDVPRFVLAEEGANLATYNPRSMVIGPAATIGNMDENIQCSTNFDEIDCNTGVTGADLGVEDDIAVGGAIWLDAGDGDGLSQQIVSAAITASDKIFTLPDANSNPVQPQTCTGDDKVSAISSAGVITCSTDQTGAGGGDPVLINGTAVTDGSGVDFIEGTDGIDITFNAGASPDTATFGLDLTEAPGAVTEANMSTEDFGDWSCAGAADDCTLDAGVVDSPALAAPNKIGRCQWNIESPTTGDDGDFQCKVFAASTLSRVSCSTTAASATIDLYERAENAPNTGTTDMLTTALVCNSDTTADATTSFIDSAVAADSVLALGVDTETLGPNDILRVYVEYTVD